VYLKSLEVQGFKSFPDKTVIRFGDDITAIVGPNGSGKSNISDAILWVMGEQSTKTLRGAKMEDIIFGGTAKRAAVGFAEATLLLDNSDRALSYDSDEVMVTRRYYRSGDSEFYINKQSARLKDIHELFMDTGLGREGYSNIGQGRIDEILSLKSADRREIFEEAAGISKYRHRKEETERKLAATEDNLLRIGDKVSELELQLEPLRVQAEKAKKYLELKDQLMGVEVAVWLDRLEKLSADAKKAEEDYTSANFVLQQAHEDLDKLYLKSAQFTEELRAHNESMEDHRVRLSMLEGIRQQIEGQIAVLRSNVENNEANIRRSQEDLQGQEARSSGISTQMEQTDARIIEIEDMLSQKREALEGLQRELTEMTAAAQGLTRQYMTLREKEARFATEIAAKEADLRGLENLLGENGGRAQQLRDDLESGKERQAAAEEELAACRKNLAAAREQVTAVNNTIAGYTLRQTTRAKRRDDLMAEVQKLHSTLESVQAKVQVFQAMEQDFEGYQKSVRMVMQEAKRGTLRNVHGPVSQLIRTEDDLTVAIEIALAGGMQQIVVDTEQDGKSCISFLKRTGGGRATFLPLNVIRGKSLTETGLERCNGFIGIASTLVTFDEKYRGIIENLLGRIVIVRDIDNAISMAKQYSNRFKIVTLDGQVVNPGGSMTGGSVSREAGILSRANELEKLTQRQQKLTEELSKLEEQYTEARRQADEVEFQLAAAKEERISAEKEVLSQEGREKQLEIWLQAILDAVGATTRELEGIRDREKADREQCARIRGMLTQMEREQTETVKLRETLEGSQLDADASLEKVTATMQQLRTEMAALDAERITAQNHIADLRALYMAAEGDRTRKLRDIDLILEDTRHQEALISEQEEKRLHNEKELSAATEEMNAARKRYADMEASRAKCDGDIAELNKSIVNMEKACVHLASKKEKADFEEKTIIDKLWDSYGLTPGTAQQKKGEIESVTAGSRIIAELKRKISALGTPNLGAIEEYTRINERYTYLAEQRDDVLEAKRDLESIIRDITGEMTTIFVTEFNKINEYFGKTFEEMFGGGKGQLVLEDPENPLTCGIEIRVQPPGKQLKTITLLSGGEKAFVAIALYFAILKVRPTPFCMLDEIDAALDDRNVERFATYLRNLGEKTQFIVITHRRGTMEASDVLYGVTMQEQGVSKLLRLDLNQMEQQLGIIE